MLPMTPAQSWMFLFLIASNIISVLAVLHWRAKYWDNERMRLYLARENQRRVQRLIEADMASDYQMKDQQQPV